jgi:hypothetical protein
MEYYVTVPRTSVKKLISLGLEVELSQDRRILKIKVSDKELTKFKCDLIEEDYPKEFSDTFSILELNFDHPPKRKDSTLSYFSSKQSEDLIFGYFQYGLMSSFEIEVCNVKLYYL